MLGTKTNNSDRSSKRN
uniref:Uncharacterized protein n=1 Tax=Rhizophora mucronata TaxID=61149 RepID=A0A2P2N8W9_RHIMU